MNHTITMYSEAGVTLEAISQPKLGILIKENRKTQRLSQRQLGEQLGVSYQTVAYWENGLRAPTPINLKRLAIVLGKPENFFFHRVEKQNSAPAISSLAENLRNYRRIHGISQVKLSEQTGIALNRIKAYEDENSGLFITDENTKKLSDFFNVSPQDLLGQSTTAEMMENKHRQNCIDEINRAIEVLNVLGLQKAAERINEITELSRYRL